MKIVTVLTYLVAAHGSLLTKRLQHGRILAALIASPSKDEAKQVQKGEKFLEDATFWSHRLMKEFSSLCLSLETTIAPSPEFQTNATSSPAPSSNGTPSQEAPSLQPFPPSLSPAHPANDDKSNLPSDIPSLAPSMGPTPTFFQAETVFGCTSGGVKQVPPPYNAISVLSFEFEYLVESHASLESYQDRLERVMFLIAVSGALQCSKGTSLLEYGALDLVDISTRNANGTCASYDNTAMPEATFCYHLTTSFDVPVEEELDSDVAVFLGYIFLRDELDGGLLENDIPGIVRGQYLGPLPTLPINVEEDDDAVDENPTVYAKSRLTVSAWTVGTVVAMSVGGFLALVAWFRNRRTRNRRHIHLVEEMSLASPISDT